MCLDKDLPMQLKDFLDVQFLTEMFNIKSAPGYDFEISTKEEMPAMFALAWQATFTADNDVEYAFRVFRAREYGKNSRRLVFMRRKSKNLSQNITIDHGTFKKVIVTFLRCYEAYKDSADGQKCSSVAISMQPGVVKHAGLFMRAVKRAFRADKRKQLNLVGVNEEGLKGNVELMMQVTMSPYPYWGGKDYDSVAFTTNPTYQQLAGIKDSTHLPVADIDDNGTDPVVAAPDKNVNGSSEKDKHFSISRDDIEYMFDWSVDYANAEWFVDAFSNTMKGGNEVILKNGQGGAKLLAIYVHSDLKRFTVLMQDHEGQSMPPFTGTPKQFFDSHAVISFSPAPTPDPQPMEPSVTGPLEYIKNGIKYKDNGTDPVEAKKNFDMFSQKMKGKIHVRDTGSGTLFLIDIVTSVDNNKKINVYIYKLDQDGNREKFPKVFSGNVESFFASYEPADSPAKAAPVKTSGFDAIINGVHIIDDNVTAVTNHMQDFIDAIETGSLVRNIWNRSVGDIQTVEFHGEEEKWIEVSFTGVYDEKGDPKQDFTEDYESVENFFSHWKLITQEEYEAHTARAYVAKPTRKTAGRPVVLVDTSFYDELNTTPISIGPVKVEFEGVSTIEVIDKIQEIQEYFGQLPTDKVIDIAEKMKEEIVERTEEYQNRIKEELGAAGAMLYRTGDPREDAISKYTGDYFAPINSALRDSHQGVDIPTWLSGYIKDIDSLFEEKGLRLPNNISVFRGQSVRQEDITALNEGSTYELVSYTSTSLKPAIGYEFTKTTTFSPDMIVGTARRKARGDYKDEEFSSEQGSKIFLDINGLENTLSLMIEKLSKFAAESEVLLDRGTLLKMRGNHKVVKVAGRKRRETEGVYYAKVSCVQSQNEGIKGFRDYLFEKVNDDGMTARDHMNMLLAFLVDVTEKE